MIEDRYSRAILEAYCVVNVRLWFQSQLEEAGKLSVGVKGMDRTTSSTCLSDNLNTWIGSL